MSYYKTGDANLAALDAYQAKQAKADERWEEFNEELDEVLENADAVYALQDFSDLIAKYSDFDGVFDYVVEAIRNRL